MLVLLVEKVVDLIILLMLLMFICKVNFLREFQNWPLWKHILVWQIPLLFSLEFFRSAKAGYYASRYKRFGNLCYVIGALQAFIGHQNQDLRIKVGSTHVSKDNGLISVLFFFFFTSILLYDSVSCGVFFHRSIIVFS